MNTKQAVLGIIIAILVFGTLTAWNPANSQIPPDIFVVNPTNPANPAAKDGNFTFSTETTSVGFKFNATLWASGFETTAVFGWQVRTNYNATILNVTRAWIAPTTDPDYIFFGQSSLRPVPFLSNGSVLIGDTMLIGTAVASATPKKLGIIEFQIMLAPSTGKVSCNLDITNVDTFLLDDSLNEIPITKINGHYELAAPAVPDFTVSASPSSLTIAQGNSGTSTINVTSLDGFNSAVNLTISGLPNGVSASFDPTSITPPPDGSITSNLTINVGASVASNTYPLTINATSATQGHSAIINLTVTAAADFSLAATPPSLTIALGDSTNSTVTVTSVNGFSQAVDLSVSGAPTGVTTALSENSVTPPPDGETTSILTINVGPSTVPGTYTLTVTGTSGALTHNVTVELTVAAAQDFSISASPTSLTIVQGASDTSTITIGSLMLFSSPVTLSVTGAPTGVTTTFSANPVTPPSGSFTTSTLTVNVGPSTSIGPYSLTVTGTAGALTHNTTIALTVTAPPDFTVAASPTSLSIALNSSANSTITITSLNGFTSEVNLSISGLPIEATGIFTPTSVTPPSDGAMTSTLTVTVSASATPGTFTLTVTGISGALEHNATLSLTIVTVPAPDFSIAASPDSLDIIQGESGNSTVTVTSLNGFNAAVDLTFSGLPANTTAAFDLASVTPPSGGSVTSILTINVGPSTLNGTYSILIIGTSGALTHNFTISLTVLPAPIPVTPDFSLSASPSGLIILQGSSDNSTITIASLNGFNSTVDLTVSGLPTNTTAIFSLNSVTPPSDGSNTSILTINVGSTPVGTYSITIIGTSGTLTHNVNITLSVAIQPPAPDFSVSASPSSLTIAQGTSGTSNITVTSLHGFNSTVTLAISGLPAGATGTFNPTAVTPPPDGNATSTLTITVGASVTPGTNVLIVTTTRTSQANHTAAISLTVTAAPDFAISASPNSLTIVQGASGTSTITVTSLNGFNSAVNLSTLGLPTGATGNFSLVSITPTANGTATSTLTIHVGLSTATGTYSIIVTGTGQGKTHNANISLTVTAAADFAISASPSSLTIVQGSSGNSTITITSLNGFNQSVALSVSGAPTGVTTTLSSVSVTPHPNGSVTSKLTVSADMTATAGNFTLTIIGKSGALTHNTTISLTITRAQVIAATVSIEPRTLNLESNGRWITCRIGLPENFSVADIDFSTIKINDTILAELRPMAIGDHELMLKFDRASVEQFILNSVSPTQKFMIVTLTVSGRLNDGRQFQGSDTIKIILPTATGNSSRSTSNSNILAAEISKSKSPKK